MSDPIVLTYPATDTALMASTQNVVSGQPFLLNGSTPYVPISTGPLILWQMQRYLTVTSTDNMSAVNFVFTGTSLGGGIVSETLGGPNANTVITTKQYQTLTSVIPSNNATNTSIGIGIGATFEWKQMDYFREYAQFSYQGVVSAGIVSYSVLQTLDRIQNVSPTLITGFPNNDSVATPYTTNEFYSFAYPVTALQLIVNNTTTTSDGALTFTIVQQGIR